MSRFVCKYICFGELYILGENSKFPIIACNRSKKRYIIGSTCTCPRIQYSLKKKIQRTYTVYKYARHKARVAEIRETRAKRVLVLLEGAS